jgi:hypothetical protein
MFDSRRKCLGKRARAFVKNDNVQNLRAQNPFVQTALRRCDSSEGAAYPAIIAIWKNTPPTNGNKAHLILSVRGSIWALPPFRPARD